MLANYDQNRCQSCLDLLKVQVFYIKLESSCCRIHCAIRSDSIDRELDSIDRKSCRLLFYRIFQLNSSPLRIRVSNLFLLVYKGNPKHVFMCVVQRDLSASYASFVFRVLYPKTLSCLLPVLFLEESQDSVLYKLLHFLVIKGVDDLNLQGWSWSHKQESLCC